MKFVQRSLSTILAVAVRYPKELNLYVNVVEEVYIFFTSWSTTVLSAETEFNPQILTVATEIIMDNFIIGK